MEKEFDTVEGTIDTVETKKIRKRRKKKKYLFSLFLSKACGLITLVYASF